MVGLGRIELPTSPLSGVRSSRLSYRPVVTQAEAYATAALACFSGPEQLKLGGAGRDRTGDLLNANQALSQLSYSPLIHKISNRGRLDADRKTSSRSIKERFIELEKRETEAWTRKTATYLNLLAYARGSV